MLHERSQEKITAVIAGRRPLKGQKRKRSYLYKARVIGAKTGFVLESDEALESDATVEHDGAVYRVAYVYTEGEGPTAQAVAILRVEKKRRGRPRTRKK